MKTNLYLRKITKEIQQVYNRPCLSERQISYSLYNNALISPDKRFSVIEYDRVPKEDVMRGKFIYIGFFISTWGHALTDSFRKLWFLFSDEGKFFINQGFNLVYTTDNSSTAHSSTIALFSLLGFDLTKCIHIKHNTRVDTLVVPNDCFGDGLDSRKVFFTKEYTKLLERIRATCGENKNDKLVDKVYFSRSHFPDPMRRDIGEKDLERVFYKMGYKIYYPETLPVKQQIELVANCSSFVATEGSISHISAFCKPGTEVVILKKASYVNGFQLAIGQAANLRISYIDAHCSYLLKDETPFFGPFYLCITKELEKFVGHKILHIPYYFRPSWWLYMNSNRKIVKRINRIIKAF